MIIDASLFIKELGFEEGLCNSEDIAKALLFMTAEERNELCEKARPNGIMIGAAKVGIMGIGTTHFTKRMMEALSGHPEVVFIHEDDFADDTIYGRMPHLFSSKNFENLEMGEKLTASHGYMHRSSNELLQSLALGCRGEFRDMTLCPTKDINFLQKGVVGIHPNTKEIRYCKNAFERMQICKLQEPGKHRKSKAKRGHRNK